MKTSLTAYFKVISLLILSVILSCKRSDGITVVEGQVVDKYTGKAIPNAIVGAYSVSNNSSSGGFNKKEMEKQADDKGNFSFSFESEDSRDYALIAKANNYATNDADPVILEEDRKNKKLKVKMEPYAWVRVKFVNVSPKDPVSSLHLQSFADMLDGKDYTSLTYFKRDTTFVRKVLGNRERIFLFEMKDLNGQVTTSNPTLYFPAHETVDLILTY